MSRRKPTPIAEAVLFTLLDRYYQEPADPELRRVWSELWESVQAADETTPVTADDFFLVAHFGFYLKMFDGQYADAEGLLRAYLARVDAYTADEVDYATAACGVVLALLDQGKEEPARSFYEQLLSSQNRRVRWIGIYQMRQHIAAYLDQQDPDELVDVGWAGITQVLLSSLAKPRSLASGSTNGQLMAVLEAIPREPSPRRKKTL